LTFPIVFLVAVALYRRKKADPSALTVLNIPQVEGVSAIFVFYCARCKHAEIKVQEDAA
jgi:hypothetical protein